MLGCPLDQAFLSNGETTTIVKKKKKKDRERKDIIYENELKPVNDFSAAENDFSQVKQRLQSLSPYDDTYSPYEQINRGQQQQRQQQGQGQGQGQHQGLQDQQVRQRQQVIQRPPEEIKEQRDMIQISNEEYRKYKDYQQQRYNGGKMVEGFDSINDNFNDIILFALTGIFFIIFTDYIYKLGKKSY